MAKLRVQFSNNASSQLAAGVGAGDVTLALLGGSGAEFPSINPANDEWFPVTLYDDSNNVEIVHVTARTGDTLTVARGQEGTVARGWLAGTKLDHRITAEAVGSKADRAAPALTGPVNVTGELNVDGTAMADLFSGPLNGNTTGTHTGPVVGNVTGNVTGTAGGLSAVLGLDKGGTGGADAATARTNLGLSALATAATVALGSQVSGALPVVNGGTGATTALQARANLGLSALATAAAVDLPSQTSGILPVARGGIGVGDPSGYAKGNGTTLVWSPTIPAADISGLAASATTNTTDAANIATGILAAARMGIESSIGASGYYKLPGGLTIQWGRVDSGSTAEGASAVVFPTPFPSACHAVMATALNVALSNSQDVHIQSGTPTTTGVSFYRQAKGTISQAISFYWVAIGV